MSKFSELIASRELLLNLILREVRGKYKRTIFGQLWSLANPLASVIVYTIVFGFVLRITPEPGDPSGLNVFAVWLLCGLIPWIFFANVVQQGMGSILNNAGLVQKVYFPRLVLPASYVGSIGYNWLFEMAVVMVVILLVGGNVIPWIPMVLLLMLLLALFSFGVVLALSIANVYFRDTQYLVGVLLQLFMYMTPIIYPLSLVQTQSEKVGGLAGTNITLFDIYMLNPMTSFVEAFRNVLYDNRFPEFGTILVMLLSTAIALVVGFLVFNKNEKGLAEAL
jgi:ABC-2 type transport system permease protein